MSKVSAPPTRRAENITVSAAMLEQRDFDLSQRSISGTLAYLVSWIVLTLGTDITRYNPPVVYLTGCSLFLLTLWRIFLIRYHCLLYERDRQQWRRLFWTNVVASGTVWSLFTAWGLTQVGLGAQGTVMLLPLLMISAGATSHLSPDKSLFALFTHILIWPQIGILAYMATTNAYLIALGMLLLGIFTLLFGKNVNRDYFQLLHKNDLLEQQTTKLAIAKETADSANQSKSRFLANISHELRTPMNGILGASELLAPLVTTPQQQRYVALIHRSGNALLSLLNDLLDFSKIEAGKMELEMTTYSIREMTTHLQHLLSIRAEEKGLGFSIHINDAIPAYLVGDEVRIQQVLLNLLGNAIKFTEEGSVALSICLTDDNARLRFEIRDTGIGIPAEKQSLLFKSFQQTESSTARKYGGTGLGLAISRQLVKLMQGEIGVYSVAGEGSCFWFEIPYQQAGESPLAEAPATAADVVPAYRFPTDCRILLAEDNAVNQLIAQSMLETLGLTQVDTVGNGAEAIRKLAGADYDLVLMDVQMPECDGLEATRHIRGTQRRDGLQQVRNPAIPVIALTANIMPADIEKCLQAGMNGHLGKPLNTTALTTALARQLSASPAQPQQDDEGERVGSLV